MVKTISRVKISHKKVLLRADFDVSFKANLTIADDIRIRQNLPTIKHLLKNDNKLICVAKLGRPKKRHPRYSLKMVVKRLQKYLPKYKVILVADFLKERNGIFARQRNDEILVLENIRFYRGERDNDSVFAKKLAELADVYVNDAFAVCHRVEASVVGVPVYLPSFAGLLLAKEIEVITKVIKKPKRPMVVIIGGAKKISKLKILKKLFKLADDVLLGGLMARELIKISQRPKNTIVLPVDIVVGEGRLKRFDQLKKSDHIFDIGPETQARFAAIIARARTIIWNGPMGYIENPAFRRGTDFIYYAITQNQQAVSLIGGGDTLAAISKKEYLEKITHLSTGGGAMLEFIEKGTLPGIEALRR